ncbi:MAG: PLP-dependent aminotransferase family protein [Roseburia sp.]
MKELWIDLQPDSDKALYEQIYDSVRRDIADGKISPGEKLPSTRFLAKYLGISRSTVELAYDQLTAEGYIIPRQGSGCYVCDISDLYQMQQNEEKREHSPMTKSTIREAEIRFSPYEIDQRSFPCDAWYRVNKNVSPGEQPELLMSGDSKGQENLRRQISRYLYQARGVECCEDQIIVGAGNEYLLMLLSQILGHGKCVLMEQYSYVNAYKTFCNMGYSIATARTEADGICMEDVRGSKADVVYVMPVHQFPLGTVMPLKRRLELIKWASEAEDRYVIEDDHDSEFRYKGKPIPALWGNDQGQHVIYIGTFSKSISSSLRISFMVLPERLMEQYEKRCGFYACTVSRFSQEVLFRFMEEGHFERHLNRMRNNYKQKHDVLLAILKEETWVHAIYGDNAGLHVLVDVYSHESEETLCRRAWESGVEIHGLSEYRIGPAEKRPYPTILLGYGNLSEEEMSRGIACLREIFM